MNNNQAQSYAIVALSNLIDSGDIQSPKKDLCRLLESEMYSLMDWRSEKEIERLAMRVY